MCSSPYRKLTELMLTIAPPPAKALARAGRRARATSGNPSPVSRIRQIRARNVGFSRAPTTLRRNLVSNTSLFEDFESKPRGWFGSVFCTVVEVETETGAVGIGTAGAFGGAAKSIVELYLADLVVGLDSRRHEAL